MNARNFFIFLALLLLSTGVANAEGTCSQDKVKDANGNDTSKYVELDIPCGSSGHCKTGGSQPGLSCQTDPPTAAEEKTAKELGVQPKSSDAGAQAQSGATSQLNAGAAIGAPQPEVQNVPPNNSPQRIDIIQLQPGGLLGQMFGNYTGGDLTKLPGGGDAVWQAQLQLPNGITNLGEPASLKPQPESTVPGATLSTNPFTGEQISGFASPQGQAPSPAQEFFNNALDAFKGGFESLVEAGQKFADALTSAVTDPANWAGPMKLGGDTNPFATIDPGYTLEQMSQADRQGLPSGLQGIVKDTPLTQTEANNPDSVEGPNFGQTGNLSDTSGFRNALDEAISKADLGAFNRLAQQTGMSADQLYRALQSGSRPDLMNQLEQMSGWAATVTEGEGAGRFAQPNLPPLSELPGTTIVPKSPPTLPYPPGLGLDLESKDWWQGPPVLKQGPGQEASLLDGRMALGGPGEPPQYCTAGTPGCYNVPAELVSTADREKYFNDLAKKFISDFKITPEELAQIQAGVRADLDALARGDARALTSLQGWPANDWTGLPAGNQGGLYEGVQGGVPLAPGPGLLAEQTGSQLISGGVIQQYPTGEEFAGQPPPDQLKATNAEANKIFMDRLRTTFSPIGQAIGEAVNGILRSATDVNPETKSGPIAENGPPPLVSLPKPFDPAPGVTLPKSQPKKTTPQKPPLPPSDQLLFGLGAVNDPGGLSANIPAPPTPLPLPVFVSLEEQLKNNFALIPKTPLSSELQLKGAINIGELDNGSGIRNQLGTEGPGPVPEKPPINRGELDNGSGIRNQLGTEGPGPAAKTEPPKAPPIAATQIKIPDKLDAVGVAEVKKQIKQLPYGNGRDLPLEEGGTTKLFNAPDNVKNDILAAAKENGYENYGDHPLSPDPGAQEKPPTPKTQPAPGNGLQPAPGAQEPEEKPKTPNKTAPEKPPLTRAPSAPRGGDSEVAGPSCPSGGCGKQGGGGAGGGGAGGNLLAMLGPLMQLMSMLMLPSGPSAPATPPVPPPAPTPTPTPEPPPSPAPAPSNQPPGNSPPYVPPIVQNMDFTHLFSPITPIAAIAYPGLPSITEPVTPKTSGPAPTLSSVLTNLSNFLRSIVGLAPAPQTYISPDLNENAKPPAPLSLQSFLGAIADFLKNFIASFSLSSK